MADLYYHGPMTKTCKSTREDFTCQRTEGHPGAHEQTYSTPDRRHQAYWYADETHVRYTHF